MTKEERLAIREWHKEHNEYLRTMWDLSFSILDKYCPELNTNPPYGCTLRDSPLLLQNAVFDALSNEKINATEVTKDIFFMIQSCEYREKILDAICFDETVQRAKLRRKAKCIVKNIEKNKRGARLMKERERKIAERFGILEKVEKLEKELLTITGVAEVDFDLNGFYDNMNQVIFLTKYDIPVGSLTYFAQRKELLASAKRIAEENDLYPSGDPIEDYGEWFYFVRDCGKTWREAVKEAEVAERD